MARKALRSSQAPDEPNLVLPLASSINERGVQGFTHSVTNSEDQRKLNCMYEVSKNPMTGKGTLVLTKRPGVTINAQSYGSASDTALLVSKAIVAGALSSVSIADTPWVYFTGGISVKVADSSTTTTLFTDPLGYRPAYVDITAISSVPNVILQSRLGVNELIAQRVFYGTAINNWTEITDPQFTGLVHRGKMEHLDGFALIIDADGKIWNSDINSISSWSGGINFLAKQIKQDYTKGLARLGNQILAFGDFTVEMFYNAGNSVGSPLGRIPQKHEETGLISTALSNGTHYYATLGNKLFFLGRQAGGRASASLFAYDGSQIDRLSTIYVEKILSESADSGTFYSINSMGMFGQGAIAISLAAPTSSTQRFLVFFPEWKEWFEWTSTVFQPVNNDSFFLGLGSAANRLYTFPSSDNWQDDGTSYEWMTQFKLPTNGAARRFMHMYGVQADTSRSANDLTVEISRDDCQTFSTLGAIDLTQDRKLAFRGGSFRNAHIRLSNTNAAETRIQNFLARID
jgi:hypothetical protein